MLALLCMPHHTCIIAGCAAPLRLLCFACHATLAPVRAPDRCAAALPARTQPLPNFECPFPSQVWIRQHETKEETVLFQELPHALRNEVAWQACKAVFRQACTALHCCRSTEQRL